MHLLGCVIIGSIAEPFPTVCMYIVNTLILLQGVEREEYEEGIIIRKRVNAVTGIKKRREMPQIL